MSHCPRQKLAVMSILAGAILVVTVGCFSSKREDNPPKVVLEKPKQEKPTAIRTLGVEESTMMAMLQQSEPKIAFKLNSASENVRIYVSESNLQVIHCIDQPSDLRSIRVIVPLAIFGSNQAKLIDDYEATIGKVAFMIKPSLKNEATNWLAKNVQNFLLKDETQATISRGVEMKINKIKNDDKTENDVLVFQFSAEQ